MIPCKGSQEDVIFKEISIDSKIEEKVLWAKLCYENFGNFFKDNREITLLLEKFRKAVYNSRLLMESTGIVEECLGCVEREGGSCCGAGIENRYSGSLLLINLLLGRELSLQRYDPGNCFFLGESGCLLIARHVICVNYICKKITDNIDLKKIISLRQTEGVELDTLFLLNEEVKKILRKLEPLNFQ